MHTEVREYIQRFPQETRTRLRAIDQVIRDIAPKAEDSISYGVPAFKLEGRPLVYYAAFKNHISLYPMTDAIRRQFADDLRGYKTSKGTIQFPLDAPLRITLVKRLVKARLAALRADAAKKKGATG